MGEVTEISWADHTFNPWVGCARVSEACTNCYAETLDKRFTGGSLWGKHAPRRVTSDANWKQPYKWNRKAAADGVRRRVFCASLADVFERHADDLVNATLDEARERLWKVIEETPHLDWLLLTKRPENIMDMVPRLWAGMKSFRLSLSPEWPANLWAGTTIESPKVYDRLRYIRAVPARVRFISAEPLLADISDIDLTGISWVIAGGESGHGARPMRPDWVRALRDKCRHDGVAFFVKQLSSGSRPTTDIDKFPFDLQIRKFPS